MKRTPKLIIVATLLIVIALRTLVACDIDKSANKKLNEGVNNAMNSGANIVENQPAPTDLDYSLERYNVIRRAYWVNGQREKAMTLPCPVTRPLGYIVLFFSKWCSRRQIYCRRQGFELEQLLVPCRVVSTCGTKPQLGL